MHGSLPLHFYHSFYVIIIIVDAISGGALAGAAVRPPTALPRCRR